MESQEKPENGGARRIRNLLLADLLSDRLVGERAQPDNGFRQIGQAFTSILTPGPASAANIFTTLRQQGVIGIPTPSRSITPADVAPFGITFPQTGPLPPFAILFQNSPDFTNPYSQQASISIDHQVARILRFQWAIPGCGR
jgi:hypothetical protein